MSSMRETANAQGMHINKGFALCLVIALRHYQTMKATRLLPIFIRDLSEFLSVDSISSEQFESLIETLHGASSVDLKVSTADSLLIQVALLHLIYSLQTKQDLLYLTDVSKELASFIPRRKSVEEVFQKLCYGLKLNEACRQALLDAFDQNRSLQIEDLFLPMMTPNDLGLYRFA